MANYKFSSDIINAALFEAGEPTDGSSDYDAQALVYLNGVYQSVWMGGSELDPTINEEWHWLKSSTPGVITLNPVITAGTVNVTNNSTSITFSSGPVESATGKFFRVNNQADVFRIASHTAASTSATLDSPYTGVDDATAGYRLMQLEYDLPSNLLRLIAPMRVYRDNRQRINGMSLEQMEAQWPLTNLLSGVPWAFAQVSESRVRFSHYGSELAEDFIRIDFDYLQRPSDLTDSPSEQPVMPEHRRKILADFVTFQILVDKNDNRADAFGLKGRNGLKAMKGENQHRWAVLGRENGHVAPRYADIPSQMQPLRTSSGLIVG